MGKEVEESTFSRMYVTSPHCSTLSTLILNPGYLELKAVSCGLASPLISPWISRAIVIFNLFPCPQELRDNYTFSPSIFYFAVKETVSSEIPRCFDAHSSKFYGEKEEWKPNDCTVCACHGGQPECVATVCRHPNCVDPIRVKGQCCPVCTAKGNTTEDSQGEKAMQNIFASFPALCLKFVAPTSQNS